MPFIKVNLNGRKYVISGLTERTSSKHILCSLARVDSTFQLETTDFSDMSVEVVERDKEVRNSRSRTRQKRVRHSSTSSLEITEWKNCLRGAVSEKSCLRHVCVMDNKKRQELDEAASRSKAGKCSRKLLFAETAPGKEKSLKSKSEFPKRIQETSSEDQGVTRNGRENENEKGEVKRRKRKTKKRPVSQDITSWKDKNESKESGGKTKFGEKEWKSADDVRENKSSHVSSCEKMDEKMGKKRKKTVEHHSRKPKHLHCHKSDTKSGNNDQYIVVDAINKPSEYRRVHRHVREELNKIKIEKVVSRTVDQRLADFHVACLHSSQRIHPGIQQQNEEETKRKLIQLINSQRKCLKALGKADKQTKKALNRYKRYLDLDKEKIPLYNVSFDREKIVKERERRSSDTDHDTGISEQHSDSSTENKQTTIYDLYKYDVKINGVVSDDVIKSGEEMENEESKTVDSPSIEDDKTWDIMGKVNSKTDDVSKNDLTVDPVKSYDVIKSKDLETLDVINNDLLNNVTEDVAEMDGFDNEHVINDVEVSDFGKGNESDQDVIIAKQTEILPYDQSEISSTAVPCCSADSFTVSTVSEISDYCSHSNSIDSQPRDIQGCQEVLMQEKARELELKQKIDRFSGEMRLMDLRILEQNKMADVLESLKNLNNELVRDDKETEPDEQTLKIEKKNLRKSIKLSMNLYEYQKGEMNDNALSLQIIEAQIKRKRWHVESAVRDLGHFVTSSLRTQLERIQSLEEVAGIKTSVVFKPQLNGTLV
ncbi:uncharacterized protein LOC116286230 [Actinia tenebrosa]|uniref:Uncharacterized protein LOC116286230 n=1 Tax=Actinia tenebrosa TaxID=6105 RepID=A0A6P8GWD8_ACTTE|nr:uncharacterized protein LOC116286230 [Actinia tenebrosa]XP_031548561.1 uncharacterized protein LOC116286230 [Actinia tenebrosa]XP_031548569.1 uncharacterized protein LOC116286230 [Actinia tenebrosa]